jgi:hypothetical protein
LIFSSFSASSASLKDLLHSSVIFRNALDIAGVRVQAQSARRKAGRYGP